MSVEAIGDRLTSEELGTLDALSSMWNGREIQCEPIDKRAALIRALALIHLSAHKEGIQAVRKLEQEIYLLELSDDFDLEEEMPDAEFDLLLQWIQTHACLLSTPELLQSEERIKLLLSDPTHPFDPLILHKHVKNKKTLPFPSLPEEELIPQNSAPLFDPFDPLIFPEQRKDKKKPKGTQAHPFDPLIFPEQGKDKKTLPFPSLPEEELIPQNSAPLFDPFDSLIFPEQGKDKKKPKGTQDTLVALVRDTGRSIKKGVREAGRKTRKAGKEVKDWSKKHKKALITAAIVAAVVTAVLLAPQLTPEVLPAGAGAISTVNRKEEKGLRKDKEEKATSSTGSSPPSSSSPQQNASLENSSLNAAIPTNWDLQKPINLDTGSRITFIDHQVLSKSSQQEQPQTGQKLPPQLPQIKAESSTQNTTTSSVSGTGPLSNKTSPTLTEYWLSGAAHGAYDVYGKVKAEVVRGVDLVERHLSNPPASPEQKSREQQAKEDTKAGHAAIDRFFNTHRAYEYDPNYKPPVEFVTGEIPFLPGNGVVTLAGRVGQIGALEGGAARAGTVASEVLEGRAMAQEAAVTQHELTSVRSGTVLENRVGPFVTQSTEVASNTGRVEAAFVDVENNVGATGFSGSKGYELKQPEFQQLTMNSPANINGRVYSGHAIDRMQLRGIKPSLVEDTIKNGKISVGKEPNTIVYYYDKHNITVILNENGDVITTGFGNINQQSK